tara:strand:+ start:2014 stop:3300 length:1287 start_codon:yes stop_codon:yes gene_type:complete
METSSSWIANVEILNRLLRKESWFNTFWAKFSGNVDISERDNGNPVYKPSGQPIEILNSFVAQGRDNMLIPFIKQLTGSPVYGDTVLKGTGEDQTMNWLRAYVNQYRKAVMKKSGSMSEQRQKVFKLYDEARPQLADWFTKWENQAIFQTFYEGVSPNLSTGTNSDGLGLGRRYHPNWYINDGGVLTTVGSEKTTKTNALLDAAVGMTAATAATCDTALTAAILRDLRVKCMELKIPQIVSEGGHKYWAMVLHPAQMASLQADSDYNNANRYGFMGKGAGAMPEVHGMAGYYSGFCLFEDIVGIREWDEAGYFFGSTTSSRFDATGVTLHADASSKRVYNAIVFGNSAVGKGVAQDLSFTDEVDDHKNTIEIGGAVINGYNRADFFTETNASEANSYGFEKGNATVADIDSAIACTNQSSLIFSTCES